jgi:hypothetical protein
MKKNMIVVLPLMLAFLIGSIHTIAQAPSRGATSQPHEGTTCKSRQRDNTERTDVATMPSPIAMHDTVWMETCHAGNSRPPEAGKTTALILTGGVEETVLTSRQKQAQQRAARDGTAIARAAMR